MEKAKIDSYFDTMNGFKQEFDVMFAKGRYIYIFICVHVFTKFITIDSAFE